MKVAAKALFLFAWLGAISAHSQISSFSHIVLIVQENRTPDNLFQGLCVTGRSCSTNPNATQYNIQTSNWLDKYSPTGVTQPGTVGLASTYDLKHSHPSFTAMCDFDTATQKCKMDGAGDIVCTPKPGTKCLAKPQFRFVSNSTGILNPYLTLATQYGWANYMFQTNQGPSFPAHQFIFGGTSAPSLTDDHNGIFAAENASAEGGCIAAAGSLVQLIDAHGVEDPLNEIFPCYEHSTLADLLKANNISWRYYTPSATYIWTAPNAISHICQPSGGQCKGPDWVNNVDLTPKEVLTDIGSCNFRQVSWVIPTGANSDHASSNDGDGPAWVASIVNAIGNSSCKNRDGTSYWNTTAIFLTWDDWGGWYDHEPPTFLPFPQGGYQYGFRVPLIVISAYTPKGYINNTRLEFGSIIRFVEHNFGIQEGALTFADARAKTEVTGFFNLSHAPRPFQTIPAAKTATVFLNDTSPPTDPDDD